VARTLLVIAGGAAALAGLYGRFKGIGIWPLGVDEFYISRSIDNVLHGGLPKFACGGYYTRGLIFQYLVAALRLFGGSPEFVGRFVAGMFSLAVLPAAYLLGKRVQGSLVGWLSVIILCLSVWEIEMARFARMYAPFQAVFAWYVVFFVRFATDRHGPALRWMAALSVLGVLTWEGGALLGIANLLAVLMWHDNGRVSTADWRRLGVLGLLLVVLVLATRDLRGFADPPTAEFAVAQAAPTLSLRAAAWFAPLWRHPLWGLGLSLPLALAVPALRWIGAFRDRWLACSGFALVLLAAAVHLFTIAAGVLLLMLLVGLVAWRELRGRQARYYWLTLGAFFLWWLACAASSADLAAEALRSATARGEAASVFQYLFGFPNVYDQVVRPWGHTLPFLSLGIAAAIGYLCWDSIVDESRNGNPLPALLSLIIVMVLAVGLSPTERLETRYTFFLYPLLVTLAVYAFFLAARRQPALRAVPGAVIASVPLLCFAASEDFQPRHLLHVDSAEINFRVGMSPARADHYYPRNDVRAIAQWLAARTRPGDVVITGIPNLDQYFPRIDYFFLDEKDTRYETYVCPNGVTERWTNHPVLYTLSALNPVVAGGHRVFAILYRADEERLERYAGDAGWPLERVRPGAYAKSDVLLITKGPDGAGGR
jgi:hypothetical protein